MKHSLFIAYLLFLLAFNTPELMAQNVTLKVEGTNNFETRIIDSISYKKSFPNYNKLNNELIDLNKKLQSIGYIESTIKKIVKTNDSIFDAKISLNQKFYTIYIYYNKNHISRGLLGEVSNQVTDNYFALKIPEVETSLNYINSKLATDGFAFANFKLDAIEKKDSKNLKANLIIDKNQIREIDNIIVKGYESFPNSFLNHFLKIKSNQVFDLNEINSKIEKLNNLSFAKQIRAPEVLFTKDSTTLYLYLEKTKSNSFDGFLGFGTNEETNKLQFDGYLNLNLTNNLNFGEQFTLIYKSDEIEQKTFDVNLSLPYLFNSPVGTEISLNIFKKDSTFTTVNQTAKVLYQINPQMILSGGIKLIQSNNLLNENNSSPIEDYNSNFFNINYTFKKTNFSDPIFPLNAFISTSFGVGNRSSELNNQKQYFIEATTLKIFNLDSKNSIFSKFTGFYLDSETLFENELYRFGGINSIRGFEENSIQASLYSVLNFEYRYRLNSGIYIHSITDFAYFENQITELNEKLFGFGFGIGVLTKAGILKLNYANGKSEDQKFKLSNSKIHLSLKAQF